MICHYFARLICTAEVNNLFRLRNYFANGFWAEIRMLRFIRFTLLVKTKKVISMNYGSSTGSWKSWRWVIFDLILSMRDIYISSNLNPLTKFIRSSRSTEFEDILPWNISQMITKTITISTRIVISNVVNMIESEWKLR